MSETQPSTAEASEGSHSGSTPAPGVSPSLLQRMLLLSRLRSSSDADFNSYVEDLDIDAAIADLLDDMYVHLLAL